MVFFVFYNTSIMRGKQVISHTWLFWFGLFEKSIGPIDFMGFLVNRPLYIALIHFSFFNHNLNFVWQPTRPVGGMMHLCTTTYWWYFKWTRKWILVETTALFTCYQDKTQEATQQRSIIILNKRYYFSSQSGNRCNHPNYIFRKTKRYSEF